MWQRATIRHTSATTIIIQHNNNNNQRAPTTTTTNEGDEREGAERERWRKSKPNASLIGLREFT
jgi:hypothetical protein